MGRSWDERVVGAVWFGFTFLSQRRKRMRLMYSDQFFLRHGPTTGLRDSLYLAGWSRFSSAVPFTNLVCAAVVQRYAMQRLAYLRHRLHPFLPLLLLFADD